jgi:hypothetical protein
MSIGAIGVIALIAIVAVAAFDKKSRRPRGAHLRLVPKEFAVEYRRQSLMTPTERKFYLRLCEALPEAVVAPQVAMCALVDVAPRLAQGKYKHVNRAKVAQQRLDFVVIDREVGDVVCVIELDDHTHDSAVRKTADIERDAILEEAGYSVLRFDARRMPSVEDLRNQFEG